MALVNTTPISIKVAEVPLSTPLFEKLTMGATWNKWFSQLSTYVTRAQENKSGDLIYNGASIGTFRATRNGNIVQVNADINAGVYDGIIVTGMPVMPIVDSPVLIQGGLGTLKTNGDLQIKVSSVFKILISASYIAAAPKENN